MNEKKCDLNKLQDELFKVLDRVAPVDALDSLFHALSATGKQSVALKDSAIGIDSSVFLRLGGHAKIADIVDYLGGQHDAPIILPGQAVQEFWNNHHSVVETVSTAVTKKFEAFKSEAVRVSIEFKDYAERVEALLIEFDTEYGQIYDEKAVRATINLLQVLKDKALVSHVPRMRFHPMAAQRKKAKTPPGFKDEGDGDFYVWVDFLYGLQQARARGGQFNRVILLTRDKKPDWSRKGEPHPILSAEVKALLEVPLELWDIEELHKAILAA